MPPSPLFPREPTPDKPEILSPLEQLELTFESFRHYANGVERLGTVNLDLQFGILEDVPTDMMKEVERNTHYMQAVARYYLGDDPEETINNMHWWQYIKLARQMKDEIDWRTMMGEIAHFSNVSNKFYAVSRRRTVRVLEDTQTSLVDVEAIASEQTVAMGFEDESELSDEKPDEARKLLKAIKIFKGATNKTFPGVTDFVTLRDLISPSSVLLLFHAAPYMDNSKRFWLARKVFESMKDPLEMQGLFTQNEWHIYLRSNRAPNRLVTLFRLHQAAFKEIQKAEEDAAVLQPRIANVHSMLSQLAGRGFERTMARSIDILGTLEQSGELGQEASHAAVLDVIYSKLKLVEDDEMRNAYGRRITQLRSTLLTTVRK